MDPDIKMALELFPGSRIAPYRCYVQPYIDQGLGGVWVGHFERMGVAAHNRGWCMIPQERTGKRKPGIFQREVIRYSAYYETRPSDDLVSGWSDCLPTHNAAILLGPSSGGVWALDIDSLDAELSDRIEALAYEVLGETAFRRVGKAPKVALLYRAETPDELPATVSRFFVNADGGKSDHGIEVLGRGRLLTAYGLHHDTWLPFQWNTRWGHPAASRPSDVPTTTKAQLELFFERVQEIRAFHGPARGEGVLTKYVDTGDVIVPRLGAGQGWVVDNGLVVDGRENYLWSLASAIARANAGKCGTDEGRTSLIGAVIAEFQRAAQMTHKWERDLPSAARDKVMRACEGITSGKISPTRQAVLKPQPKTEKIRQSPITSGRVGGLHWLPEWEMRQLIDLPMTGPDETIAAGLVIPTTAAEAGARISAEVDAAIATFMGVNFASKTTHLVPGPTGSGKTTTTIRKIKDRKDRREAAGLERDWILFLVPTYGNVKDIAKRARAAGLTVIEFRGKARTNCDRKSDVLKLQRICRSSAGLCSSENPEDPEGDKLRCYFWEQCEYQRQIQDIKDGNVDLVLAVHDYVACPLPTVLNDCAAVIIDESIHNKLIRSFRIPVDVFDYARAAVAFRTKREKGIRSKLEERKNLPAPAPVPEEDFHSARDVIATAVSRLLMKGADPASYFTRCQAAESTRRRKMLDLTIALCGRVKDKGDVTPDVQPTDIDKICAAPERRLVTQEAKFWRILRDRVERLMKDRLPVEMEGNTFASKRHAAGDRDRRIHWEPGTKRDSKGTIRVSWVAEHNFSDKSILVLDASADETLLKYVLKRPNLVNTKIETPLRLRTAHIIGRSFAKSSILPVRGDSETLEAYKQRLVLELRAVISHIAAVHPVGGIVVCLPKALRELICTGWCWPDRIIWMHYGNTRGLNVAEACSAAIAIGCINPQLHQIDDIVAAIGWEAEQQEAMLDPLGPSRNRKMDGEVAFMQKSVDIQLRHGGKLKISQNAVEGYYATIILNQIRKQEHLQFIGRLRPIYRDYIPCLYNIGSYLPEDIVVDEVLSWDDLRNHVGSAVEIAREVGGYVGQDDDEGLKPFGLADGERMQKLLAADPKTAASFFQVKLGGEVVFVPAHSPKSADRYVDEGYDLVSQPTFGHFPDAEELADDLRITREREIEMRDEALSAAWADGWRPIPGTRDWRRVDEAGEGRWRDHMHLAQIYRSRLSMAVIAKVEDPAETVAGAEADFVEA